MSGPFATASRRYIASHQVSLLSHASYSYSAGGVRCPRQQQQQQRVIEGEGTAMAPWNGPNHGLSIARGISLWISIYDRELQSIEVAQHHRPKASRVQYIYAHDTVPGITIVRNRLID